MNKLIIVIGAVGLLAYCFRKKIQKWIEDQTTETLVQFKAEIEESVRQQVQAAVRQIQPSAPAKG